MSSHIEKHKHIRHQIAGADNIRPFAGVVQALAEAYHRALGDIVTELEKHSGKYVSSFDQQHYRNTRKLYAEAKKNKSADVMRYTGRTLQALKKELAGTLPEDQPLPKILEHLEIENGNNEAARQLESLKSSELSSKVSYKSLSRMGVILQKIYNDEPLSLQEHRHRPLLDTLIIDAEDNLTRLLNACARKGGLLNEETRDIVEQAREKARTLMMMGTNFIRCKEDESYPFENAAREIEEFALARQYSQRQNDPDYVAYAARLKLDKLAKEGHDVQPHIDEAYRTIAGHLGNPPPAPQRKQPQENTAPTQHGNITLSKKTLAVLLLGGAIGWIGRGKSETPPQKPEPRRAIPTYTDRIESEREDFSSGRGDDDVRGYIR